jgi:ankyrin repeat protein
MYWLWLPVIERLLAAGASIEVRRSDGRTVLHDAVLTEADFATMHPPTADLTALLIERGADVFARMASGETAADLAQTVGHPIAERLLRARMAELSTSRTSASEE